jgi:hypothetical protein
MIFFPIISYNMFRFLFFTFCNILKIHIKKSLALKIIFKIYFKNYMSSGLYILSNLIHFMSITITSLQFISCSMSSASLARSSPLSPSLSLHPMPDNGACADPHHHRRRSAPALGPPCRLRQLARRHDSGSHLPPFSSSFFSMHDNNTFVYAQQIEQEKAPTVTTSTFTIYHTNKQGTQAACMYHQHAKHKQTSVNSAPTHTHI